MPFADKSTPTHINCKPRLAIAGLVIDNGKIFRLGDESIWLVSELQRSPLGPLALRR
jgi:hypothetical protein